MNKKWLHVLPIVFGILLVIGVLLFVILRDHPSIEGFAAPILNTPKCPENFTFFNDRRGDSFCCQGEVDRYSHTCKARGEKQMCSMKPDMIDPRTNVSGSSWSEVSYGTGHAGGDIITIEDVPGNFAGVFISNDREKAKKLCESKPECKALSMGDTNTGELLIALMSESPSPVTSSHDFRNRRSITKFSSRPNDNIQRTLPLCSSLVHETNVQNQAQCPRNLSNFASIGKCCLTQADFDGYDCRKVDNADTKRYCKLSGPLAPGEQLCGNVSIQEKVEGTCPTGMTQITYPLGDREVKKYGAAASGVQMPVCFGMDKTCIPDVVIQDLQSKGVFKDKRVDTWSYSCSGWKSVHVDRNLSKTMDTQYVS